MEKISLVALLTPIFSSLMILRSFSLYWKHRQTWRELLFWLLLWVGIAFITLYPSVLDLLPSVIGIKSGVHVLVFFGFVLLFYAFFRLFVKVEHLENKIVKMNRTSALLEQKKRKSRL